MLKEGGGYLYWIVGDMDKSLCIIELKEIRIF